MEEFKNKIIQGDCLIELKTLDENSIDSIVTDPPYHLVSIVKRFGKEGSAPAKFGTDGAFKRASTGFMGKTWDGGDIAFNPEMWKECLRVLKPGGHLLSFSGTRTYHRMAVAIEDAGFEVRDMIEWCYGSGFPKSLNIGKSVDKLQGNKREIIDSGRSGISSRAYQSEEQTTAGEYKIDKGTSEWEGWGTALKPAHEPICLARKPLSEKTVAENCLKWGTGGINIDKSRVEGKKEWGSGHINFAQKHAERNEQAEVDSFNRKEKENEGRFPANLIHDNSEEVRECFPETKSGMMKQHIEGGQYNVYGKMYPRDVETIGDSGNASRFFKSIIYQAKASKSERNKGCEGLEEKVQNNTETNSRTFNDRCLTCKKKFVGSTDTICHCPSELKITDKTIYTNKNNHPTVKPIALMEYLIKMVTPKGGIVLDPFAGSGSTLVAAKQNGYQYIGIEMTEEYIPIIEARLLGVENDLFKDTL